MATKYSSGKAYTPAGPTSSIPLTVYIEEDVLQELNEYATAALPTEIGGLARIQSCGSGEVIVTGVKMLPQHATGGTFEIDADQVTEFISELVADGRTDEVEEWCSIVHSHPVGMGPSMSGVDVDNITRLADDGHCFSLILGASDTADSERLAMHYAQATPYGGHMILKDLPVEVLASDRRAEFEAAEEELNTEVRNRIRGEVTGLITTRHLPVVHHHSRVGPTWNESQQARTERLMRSEYSRVWERPWDWWDDREDIITRDEETPRTHTMTDEEFTRHVMQENGLPVDEPNDDDGMRI